VRLEAIAEPISWPSPEISYDDDLLTSATVLFLQPARASRAKRALPTALGGEKFELLVGFLTFIRSAHYWTLMHPELAFEEDLQELLRTSTASRPLELTLQIPPPWHHYLVAREVFPRG
jgi:hypothetical protein